MKSYQLTRFATPGSSRKYLRDGADVTDAPLSIGAAVGATISPGFVTATGVAVGGFVGYAGGK